MGIFGKSAKMVWISRTKAEKGISYDFEVYEDRTILIRQKFDYERVHVVFSDIELKEVIKAIQFNGNLFPIAIAEMKK